MVSPYVECLAKNCTHNINSQCMAAKISIYNDELSGNSLSADHTQCKSFQDRNGVGDIIGALHNSNISGTIAAYVDGDKKIAPVVECFVNNCYYWNSGNQCVAGEIHITGMAARREAETDCSTFVAK